MPHQTFPHNAASEMQPNVLTIRIQPNESIQLQFQAKRPGLRMRLSPVDMRFAYHEAFAVRPPEAYETLLLDVMEGDATLFMRADQIEAAWSVITPVLIAQDGRRWMMPTEAKAAEADSEPTAR